MAHYVVGIDEVGRGPLAGPLAVGAVIIEKKFYNELKSSKTEFKDSKQLTVKGREQWLSWIQSKAKAGKLDYKVTEVGPGKIDSRGISYCLHQAVSITLNKLRVEDPDQVLILLDGGLKAPARFRHQKTIIGGDRLELAIALASIAAKTKRDRTMIKLDRKYEGYLFAKHKGYGTAEHIKAIEALGLSEIHRRSFCHRWL